jgi:hypothetical protein
MRGRQQPSHRRHRRHHCRVGLSMPIRGQHKHGTGTPLRPHAQRVRISEPKVQQEPIRQRRLSHPHHVVVLQVHRGWHAGHVSPRRQTVLRGVRPQEAARAHGGRGHVPCRRRGFSRGDDSGSLVRSAGLIIIRRLGRSLLSCPIPLRRATQGDPPPSFSPTHFSTPRCRSPRLDVVAVPQAGRVQSAEEADAARQGSRPSPSRS